MSRLPTPGSDDGLWGGILNDYLAVEHNTDGSLKIRTDNTFYAKPGTGIPKTDMAAAVQTSLGKADTSVQTTGGSAIVINDTTTQALRIDIPAGTRSSAPDTFGVYYDGSRTGYFNEYGELRVIASASSRTPLRVKQANGGGQTADLIDVTDISNNSLFTVGPTGDVSAPNLDGTSWQTVTFNTDASSSPTYATVGVRREPLYGLGRLRGGALVAGDGLTGSETLITLPVGYRPVATFSCGVRVAGSNVARQITLNTDGTVQVASSLSAGDTVLMDGIVFPIS